MIYEYSYDDKPANAPINFSDIKWARIDVGNYFSQEGGTTKGWVKKKIFFEADKLGRRVFKFHKAPAGCLIEIPEKYQGK